LIYLFIYLENSQFHTQYNKNTTERHQGNALTGASVKMRNVTKIQQDDQLSQRDRAAGCVIVFAKSRRLELGDNVLWGGAHLGLRRHCNAWLCARYKFSSSFSSSSDYY